MHAYCPISRQTNRWFDTDTQRHCAARRMLTKTACDVIPLRAGQIQRLMSESTESEMSHP